MNDDRKLRELLREWQLPDAPASLDIRVLGERKPWWTRSLRIPVPVALAIAAALVVMAVALLRQHPAQPQPSTSIDLADFHPVKEMNYRVIRGSE